jgi:ATP-binding protein involved in chromosome partitioning
MASRDEIMAALSVVPGPDGRTPLPESDAISGLTIRDGKVFLAIVVDPAKARTMEAMRAKAEATIKAVPGVASAVVTLTAEAARGVGGAGRASRCPASGTSSPSHRARAA